MKILKLVALAVVAVVVPGLLAASVFFISAHSFEAPASAVPRVRGNIASPNPQWSPAPRKSSKPKTGGAGGDVSGPCDEVEHADDPRCAAGNGPGDSSSDSEDPDSEESGSEDSGSEDSGSEEDDSGFDPDDSDGPGSSEGDD